MGKRICIIVGYGQSNEQGTAITNSGASCNWQSLYGFPLQTTSGRSSVFHVLAQILGSEGHCVWLRNLAWGGTGILNSWNGRCRTWIANNNSFAPGSWALPTVSNGRKYRAEGTPGISQSTGATEPVWPTTVDATVVDGTVTWTCKLADNKDVNGYIYQPGDSGYDPRSYISTLLAAITDAKSRGFEVWVCTAGHQSDFGNPAATVSAVLTNLMQRVLELGPDKVYLGITNRFVGDVTAPQWDPGGFYPTVRSLTLAALAGDSRVFPGGDLSIVTDPALTDPAGRVHLNDIGTLFCGQVWRNAVSV